VASDQRREAVVAGRTLVAHAFVREPGTGVTEPSGLRTATPPTESHEPAATIRPSPTAPTASMWFRPSGASQLWRIVPAPSSRKTGPPSLMLVTNPSPAGATTPWAGTQPRAAADEADLTVGWPTALHQRGRHGEERELHAPHRTPFPS